MAVSQRPRLRAVESFPVSQPDGEVWMALRDPSGFASSVVLPREAAIVAALMDGSRDLTEIQDEFERQVGERLSPDELEGLIEQLDKRCLLDNERFRARWKAEVETYLNAPVRPAAHAGAAYAGGSAELTAQLDGLFTSPRGPGVCGPPGSRMNGRGRLQGILSPHIDLRRGGPAFAWAYRRLVEESDADLFVIFGTAHQWMGNLFSASKKHFDTPLGVVQTDKKFVGRLGQKLSAQPGGKELNLFADELAHRPEHSLEFQVVFLQHLLGEHRQFKVVPILVGSFHEFIRQGRQPAESPKVQAFTAALQACVADHAGKVCFISSGDLAHIGQRFGDERRLTPAALERQSQDDRQLLATAGRVDAAGFFQHVADQQDRSRICGLSPTYAMLAAMRPRRGEVLTYGQAVEPDGTSCVSFGSVAFYGE
jgi:AmmeMemoRadiSam system protein B